MKNSKFKQSLKDKGLWNSDSEDDEIIIPLKKLQIEQKKVESGDETDFSNDSSKECVICASESYEDNFISCLYCNWAFCNECISKWLLDNNEFKCMNCKKIWSMQFLYENLNQEFYNKQFKHHKDHIIIEREMSYIPETMVYVEREMIQRKSNELYKDIKHMLYYYNTKLGYTTKGEYKKFSHEDLKNSIIESILKLYELKPRMILGIHIDFLNDHVEHHGIQMVNRRSVATEKNEQKDSKPQIYCNCKAEECKGLMKKKDSKTLSCMICFLEVCFHCEEKMDSNHKCDSNNKESIAEIRKSTKQCPKCHTAIYRTQGCSQMWCTNCNTSFDWNTGEQINGTIHNPHYFEYLSKLNRDNIRREIDLNQNCLEDWMITQKLHEINDKFYIGNFTNINIYLLSLYRLHVHVNRVELRTYASEEYTPQLYRTIRLNYLLSDITKESMERKIIMSEKKREYKKETYDHLVALSNLLYEVCTNFVSTDLTKINLQNKSWGKNLIKSIKEQVNEIMKLFNENMYYIHCKYKYSSHIYISYEHGDFYCRVIKSHMVRSDEQLENLLDSNYE